MSGDIGEKLNQLRQLHGLVDHSVADMLDEIRRQPDATATSTARPDALQSVNRPTKLTHWGSFLHADSHAKGYRVLATLDEQSYQPEPNLSMGADHPIVWTHCVGRGRTFYWRWGINPQHIQSRSISRC